MKGMKGTRRGIEGNVKRKKGMDKGCKRAKVAQECGE